jgi:IS5 family transposase
MSNKPDQIDESDIPETDFSDAVRGKYYRRAIAATNLVLLEPDVAKVFRDSAVVSQALREYLQEHGGPPSSVKRAG